tara:strand:- start:2089 stop:2730 length:642 start_codon:yes stop_codon:yes gene_type:complete
MQLYEKERAKDIYGYEGLYSITSFGRVWSHKKKNNRQKFLKKEVTKAGYERVRLGMYGERIQVHRLVAMAFTNNDENKPCVNHIDANPLNNNIENLEWCTHKENTMHAQKLGNMKQISDELKKRILSEYETGDFSRQEIADKYNVSTFSVFKATSHLVNRIANKVVAKNKKGKIMYEFKSVREAAKSMGISHPSILSSIKRDGICNGFKWEVA